MLCQVSKTIGKALKTFGKGFIECDTRQRKLDELYIGNGLFAEYFLSGTQQRLAECHLVLGKEKSQSRRQVTGTERSLCRVPKE
jgi:hypothetical protein